MYPTELIVLSTVLSTAALIVAVIATLTARRLSRWQSWPFGEIQRLQARMDDLDVQLTQHHERIRRVNARLAAKDRRRRAAAGTDADDQEDLPLVDTAGHDLSRRPGEDELTWKRRIRALIAQGKVGHGR